MSQQDKDLPDMVQRGRMLDARLHLLDRQLLGDTGDPVGTVDDLELTGVDVGDTIIAGTPAPRITGILSGHVLATRIFGGQPPRSRLQAIPWKLVRRIGTVIDLDATDMAFDNQWREHWLRDHVIARIPGGRHAAQ
jgi:sporulation protein YlmC with PRC-barrel domain